MKAPWLLPSAACALLIGCSTINTYEDATFQLDYIKNERTDTVWSPSKARLETDYDGFLIYVEFDPRLNAGAVSQYLGPGDANPRDFHLEFTSPYGSASGGPGFVHQSYTGEILTYRIGSSALTAGTRVTAELGGNQVINWGRWTLGTYTDSISGTPPTAALGIDQGLHYIVGLITPPANLPMSGQATFNLVGATRPTWVDGAFPSGTFTGSFAVSWAGSASTKVGTEFRLAMPNDTTYVVTSPGGLASPQVGITPGTAQFSGDLATTTAGRACAGAPCAGSFNGFFAGTTAQFAGIRYILGASPATSIQGVAVFGR